MIVLLESALEDRAVGELAVERVLVTGGGGLRILRLCRLRIRRRLIGGLRRRCRLVASGGGVRGISRERLFRRLLADGFGSASTSNGRKSDCEDGNRSASHARRLSR